MSAFDDNSSFYLDSANEGRNRGELDNLDPYSPIPPGRGVPIPTGPPQDQLERWYAVLNEEAGLVTQEGRTRVAADQTEATLRMVADEIYSYLRG